MIELRQTDVFEKWESKLKDKRLRLTIATRLNRLVYGNAGDVKPVGEGVSELRIDYGPGYRVYFQRRGNTVVLLLCGGDKGSQSKNIATAKILAKECGESDG